MLSREEMESREAEHLARYAVHSGRTRGRTYAEEEHPTVAPPTRGWPLVAEGLGV